MCLRWGMCAAVARGHVGRCSGGCGVVLRCEYLTGSIKRYRVDVGCGVEVSTILVWTSSHDARYFFSWVIYEYATS